MSERKRFHPLAIVIFWFNSIRKWLYFLILLALNGELFSMFGLIATGLLLLLTLIVAVVKYFSQTYYITPEKIMIYQGIFLKRELDIPYGRIQTIKQRQWFFFRPFNIIQLLIETAGGTQDKAEASLPAVSETLLEMIEHYRHSDEPQQTETLNEKTETPAYDYKVLNSQILVYGLTDLSVLAPLFFLISLVDEFIPETWLTQASSAAEELLRAGWLIMMSAIVVVLLLIFLISLAKNFFQLYNFQVTRQQNTLTIESGLFERKVQKVPIDKIQGLRIHQQLLRKVFKLSSVELMLAGGQEVAGESMAITKLYLLPIISDNAVYETIASLVPEWRIEKPAIEHASYKSIWYFWRWNLLLVPVVLALFWFNLWVGIFATVIFVVILISYWLDYRYQGYAIQTSKRICFQTFTLLTKVQTFVDRPKIQSFDERTSKWLHPKGIGHVKLFLKTGLGAEEVSLRFIKHEHVEELRAFYQI